MRSPRPQRQGPRPALRRPRRGGAVQARDRSWRPRATERVAPLIAPSYTSLTQPSLGVLRPGAVEAGAQRGVGLGQAAGDEPRDVPAARSGKAGAARGLGLGQAAADEPRDVPAA